RPGTGEPLLRPLVVELAGGRAVHGVVGAAVVGAPVLGLPVVGLPVVGLPVVGLLVVGLPVVGLLVVGLPVVGPSVVGPSVIGTAQRAVLRPGGVQQRGEQGLVQWPVQRVGQRLQRGRLAPLRRVPDR